MKKLSFLIVLLLCTSVMFAQVKKDRKKISGLKKTRAVKVDPANVPQAVKDAQTKQFPGTQKIKWKEKAIKTKEGETKDFIAAFMGTDGIVKAHYKPDGTAALNIYHYKADKVPVGVASKAKSNYPNFEIKRGDKLHFVAKNRIVYRLIMTKPAAKLILYTDENGNDAQKVEAAKDAMDDGDEMDEGEGDMDDF